MEWKPIASAPKDGTHIWAIIRSDHGRLAGRCFEIWHEGVTLGDYDLGWAIYPGYGGVPDDAFAGWMPLPTPPETHNGQ